MQRNFQILKYLLFSLCLAVLFTQVNAQQDVLLDLAQQELKREFEVLSKEENPAYYIDYRIDDISRLFVAADLGVMTQKDSSVFRVASAQVRVGSYDFDNTYVPKAARGYRSSGVSSVETEYLPVDNESDPIKLALWNLTLRAYLKASESYESLIAGELDTNEKTSPSFSQLQPTQQYIEPRIDYETNEHLKEWITKVKTLSNMFNQSTELEYGVVSISIFNKRSHFISSEGSLIAENQPYAYMFVNAAIRGNDQSIIPLSKSYFAFKPDDFPTEAEIKKDIDQMIALLVDLKMAPPATPYSGPAILHPRAAGVFFHEIFGHRIEGHRLGSDNDGQTYKERINELVLPKNISVYSDPTMKRLNNQDLNGSYVYDDQGVKSSRVTLVEQGVLKSFLMSRAPLDSLLSSNGHGRAQSGNAPVSRQANLIVEATGNVTTTKLRAMLIEECIKQGKEFGYYFMDVEGGYTETSRYSTNAFNIQPTIVYRVYVDGRPDELVKGVDLIGTPLSMFAEIAATSDAYDTFIGFCGAESGSVPVSANAPGILVRRIETQKKPEAETYKDKFLARPTFNTPPTLPHE